MRLIEMIENERIKQGLSKNELVEKTDGIVTSSMYSKYVLNKVQAGEEKLIALSQALGKKFVLEEHTLQSIEELTYTIKK